MENLRMYENAGSLLWLLAGKIGSGQITLRYGVDAAIYEWAGRIGERKAYVVRFISLLEIASVKDERTLESFACHVAGIMKNEMRKLGASDASTKGAG